MAGNRMICHCKQVDYIQIRHAMVEGARTIEEIKEKTGAGTVCGRCIPEIEEILASVCGCTGTSLEAVVAAVNEGAQTVEAVGEKTGAGTRCGRCKPLIENVIKLGK